MAEGTQHSYLVRVISFYFRPSWESFFTILYLLLFLYGAVFYSGNVLTALRFLFYTFNESVGLLGLSYLVWGVVFLVALVLPFSVSIYAIFLLYELWHSGLSARQRILSVIMLLIAVPLIIAAMDSVMQIVSRQSEIQAFLEQYNLLR